MSVALGALVLELRRCLWPWGPWYWNLGDVEAPLALVGPRNWLTLGESPGNLA